MDYSNGSGCAESSDHLHTSGGSRGNIFNNNINQPIIRRSSVGDPRSNPGSKSHAELPIVRRNNAPPRPISGKKLEEVACDFLMDWEVLLQPILEASLLLLKIWITCQAKIPKQDVHRRRSNDDSGNNNQVQSESRRQNIEHNDSKNRPSINPPPPPQSSCRP